MSGMISQYLQTPRLDLEKQTTGEASRIRQGEGQQGPHPAKQVQTGLARPHTLEHVGLLQNSPYELC